MTRVQRALLAVSTGATLLVLTTVAASATSTGREILQAGGQKAVLMASTASNPQPNGGSGGGGGTSGTGLGPAQVSIGDNWALQGQLITSGTVTVTCGPFVPGTTSSSGNITVEEVVDGHVGHATHPGQFMALTCDGAAHSYPTTLLVNDLPFKAASGAAAVSVNACGETLSTLQFVCQSGSSIEPVTLK